MLAGVGGLEIAALAGLMLGGAAARRPVIVDGFIAGAAALVATRLAPGARPFLLLSHLSAERGARRMCGLLGGAAPLLELEMRLGEGTGAVLVVPLLRAAVALQSQMATFASAAVPTRTKPAVRSQPWSRLARSAAIASATPPPVAEVARNRSVAAWRTTSGACPIAKARPAYLNIPRSLSQSPTTATRCPRHAQPSGQTRQHLTLVAALGKRANRPGGNASHRKVHGIEGLGMLGAQVGGSTLHRSLIADPHRQGHVVRLLPEGRVRQRRVNHQFPRPGVQHSSMHFARGPTMNSVGQEDVRDEAMRRQYLDGPCRPSRGNAPSIKGLACLRIDQQPSVRADERRGQAQLARGW